MRNLKLCILSVFVLLTASCKKQFSEQQQKKKSIDSAKVFKIPSTPEERLLVENLAKVTDIFKELYKVKTNIEVVNVAILSKAFTDESVLLKDLIYPKVSWLNKIEKFKTLTQRRGLSLAKFADNFWFEVKRKSDPGLNQFLSDLNSSAQSSTNAGNRVETAEGQEVSVYFPYSEEFLPPDGGTYQPITSLVTATADADEGWGSLPYYDVNGVFQYYVQVLVNDDYAFTNPTHIIGVNGIEIQAEPNEPPPPPPPPPGVSRLYIGEAICKEQYDRLISFTGNGGGSEIKYCHLSAYLQPVNGQVTSFQDIVSVDFTRTNIRNKNWKRIYIIWEDDWLPNDLEQVLAIYEEDNTNTRSFNGTLGTTLDSLGIPVQASIGFNISVTSQDDIIRQLKISRNSYFAGAFQDQGHGFSPDATFLPLPYTHGWPAYDVHYWTKVGANVGWTWPYSIY